MGTNQFVMNRQIPIYMVQYIGAFVALFTGYIASLTVFIGERFIFCFHDGNMSYLRFCKIFADD